MTVPASPKVGDAGAPPHGAGPDLRALAERLARAEEAAARRSRQAALVSSVALALTADEPLEAMLRRCAEALVGHLEAARAGVWTLEPDGTSLRLAACAGVEAGAPSRGAKVSLGARGVGRVAAERRPYASPDVAHDARVEAPPWVEREGVTAYAAHPLYVAGRLVGAVDVFARRALPPDDLDALASVADAVALGIERHRLLAEARERADEQAFFAEVGALLTSSIEYETTLANVVRLAVPRLADWCAIDVLEPDRTIRRIAVAHVDPAKVALAHELLERYPPDPDAPMGMPAVLRTGRPDFLPEIPDALLVEAAQGDDALLALARDLGLRSSICVPLVANDRVLGALSLVTAESGRRYGATDLARATELARRAGAAVESARLYAEVRALNATLERRVEERTAELREANRELEAFSYTVSHDLRAPIRHVGGFADLLERHLGAALDDAGRRHLETIRGAARRMGELIDALLSLSRVGRAELRRQRVDLGAEVRAAVRELEPEAEGRAVRWSLGPLPTVAGDPTLLRLALTNLLSNALKYTRPRAEAHVEVSAAPAEEPGFVAVSVRDDGVGFPPALAGRLFQAFQRLHGERDFEGTGVGLATVRRIVQRHGGRAWAEGAEGRGAAFTITLPLAEP
ncbi:MAG: ATP-binding protein [Polyangiales bacterium]